MILLIYKKTQKRKIRGNFHLKYIQLYWGIISLTSGFITKNQLETSILLINKFMKKLGSFNILIKCTKSITRKSLKTRMGAGKGSIISYVGIIKKRKLLFEISKISKHMIYKLTQNLSYKLPFKIQFIRQIY